MKRKISLISLLMAFVIVFSCVLTGCNEEQNPNSGNEYTLFKEKGVHSREVEITSNYIVSNGLSDYKILLAENYKEYDMLAAEVINEFMLKSTGLTFPVVYDSEYKKAEDGKFISLGITVPMRNTGISVNVDKFGQSGYRIKTVDDDVYISGSKNYIGEGTYYGALDFLGEIINWRCYSIDEIHYDVKSDVEFYNFNVTEIPEFDNRRYGVYPLDASKTWMRYMRFNIKNETQINVTGHSHFEILPPSKYYDEHPDWYSSWNDKNANGKLDSQEGQLCLSNKEMTAEFVKNVVQLFKDSPDKDFIHLGQQDVWMACECKNCQEFKKYTDENGEEKEMNFAGILVKFTNTIARAVSKEIQKTEPERILYFEMFAYHSSEYPPTVKKNGVHYPMCSEVICDDNVYVQFTPNANFKGAAVPLTHEKNENVYDMLEGWKKCCKNLSTWTYAINFNWALISFPNWDSYGEDLKIFSEAGANRVYDQNHIWRNVPQMLKMRIYVESQLMWDVTQSYYDLAADFIENYYGDAAPYVQEMFDVMTSYWTVLKYEKGLIGGIYTNFDKKESWTFEYVETVRKIFVNAFNSIKHLEQTNPGEYEKYYWRVCDAYLENLYMQLQYYGANYGADYVKESIELFEKIITKFDYNYMSEGTGNPLSGYVKQWRAAYV